MPAQNRLKNTLSLFRRKSVVAVVAIAIMLSVASPLAWAAASAEPEGEEQDYVTLDSPLIVNVLSRDTIHFLQVTTEFQLKAPVLAAKVKAHMTAIKHNLIMLLSEKRFSELQTIEGKKRLREEALKTVQQVMKEKTGDPSIENIFFTSLILQ